MSARDELATVIHRRICEESLSECLEDEGYCVKAAYEILAAGYRKPRIITTAEELDALPEGTTIVDQAERLTLEETSIQCLEWVDRHGNACHIELPATVLEEAKS